MSTSRRMFITGSGVIAAGLAVPWYVAGRWPHATSPGPLAHGPGLSPNAFVHIAPDDTVTVWLGKSEMGQGVYTGLTQILAEELDYDPRRIRVEFAPVDVAFNHPAMPMQFTGGSMSINSSYESLRKAGATARAMLLAAAAEGWGVAADTLRTEDGIVLGEGQRAKYGELAEAAARFRPPREVALKDPAQFRYIGRPLRRLDSAAKITGRAQFGIDVMRPDMACAMIARAPAFGGSVRSFDDRAARAIPGVLDVKQLSSGVAVIATNTWAARRGCEALVVDWAPGPDPGLSTDVLRERYRALLQGPGVPVKNAGDATTALAGAARSFDVEYEVPYLAHACMEPLNCVAHVTAEGCEIWTGTQFQQFDQMAASRITGIPVEKVKLHTMFLGGGFGRRATPTSDFVSEAVEVAKAAGMPVKTVWTREDDIHGGYYRPMFLQAAKIGLDGEGMPVAWQQAMVGQSIMKGTPFEPFSIKDGVDSSSVEGVADSPYVKGAANHRVTLHSPDIKLPVLWWRSVGHSYNAFVMESLVDELAHAAGKDPVAYRRTLLAEHPRHLAALNLAVEKAGWGSPAAEGRARGVAVHESFGSVVAQVAEVSVDKGSIRVHKVTCAIDCGTAVNPEGIAAQMESGITFGLSAALHSQLTFKDGQVQQSNFHDYQVLRLTEMPVVDVHIVPSEAPPSGVGEPGTPPIAPAVANALFALTGKRLRSLPLSLPA